MVDMLKFIKRIYRIWLLFEKAIPHFIRIRVDSESFGITKFMEFASKKVKSSDEVLDAGAGSCPYRKYFSHAKYISTDLEDIFDKSSKHKHDFICSLDKIPKPNNSYNVIINTQVLEHVEYPQKVINEFYRILKPGGKLFLTAPQGWGIHGEPYNFFNFTKYGLESLFKNAGFKIMFIEPRGGILRLLGERIRIFPSYILQQYLFRENKNSKDSIKFKPRPLVFILIPLFFIMMPICGYFIPFLFFYLDRLDKKKDYTLGYSCYCIKDDRRS
jgi:SAM-dependent methyltransferase